GAADGTITATASEGATITIDGQAYNPSALYGPGTYTILATAPNGNNNGSCTASTSVTISEPITVTVSASVTNVTCNGLANGTITASASDGATITVNGQPYNPSALYGPGTYTIVASASNGNADGTCTATTSVTITEPITVTVSATATNVSCNGAADGTITATSSQGATITVDGQAYNPSATYGPGTYTVVATAPNGNNTGSCTATTTVTITEPIVVTIAATSTNVSCNGAADGTITATASTGATITVNGQPYSATATYGPGSYTLVATAPNGNNNGVCTASMTVEITQPIAVTVSATSTNVSCYGASDGTITASASAGATITINGRAYNSSDRFAPGTYTVVATAANGNTNGNCTATTTVTITEPIMVTISAVSTNVSCFGAADGTIIATASAGASITVNGQPYSATAIYAPGTYTVVATAANGNNDGNCTASISVVITEPIKVEISASVTDVTCNGAANGTITASASDGASITVDGQPYSASALYAPGTYTVVATAPNGNNNGSCTATTQVTITQPAVLALSSTTINPACNGTSTGSIDLSAIGGTLPYTYIWSTGAVTQDVTDIPSGSYSVTVTDAKGCTAVHTATLTQPSAIVFTATPVQIACFGGVGSVTLLATGGTGAITYGGDNTNNLTAGTYSYTATDANGCVATTTATIAAAPDRLVLNAAVTQISCYGGTGSVVLSATGGVGNYTFGGDATSPLTQGSYTYTVTDGNSCQGSVTVVISQAPDLLVANAVATQIACYGGLGSIDLQVTGGTTAYGFSWTKLSDANYTSGTEDLNSLTAGTYSVTVQDAKGCTATASATINAAPAVLAVTSTATQISCFGQTGSVSLNVTGGTPDYTYAWTQTGGTFTSTSVNITGLTSGRYNVTVTDANGCTASTYSTINTQPALLTSSSVSGTILCNGGTTVITVSAGGGVTPYSGTGAYTVGAGSYNYTVTDANGCQTVTSIVIGEPTALVAASSAPVILCGGGSATATVSATGGISPYSGTGTFTVGPGTYTYTVTDANNCTSTTVLVVDEPVAAVLLASASSGNILCNGDLTTVTVTATGGTIPYTGTGTFTEVAAGVHAYTVTDVNGCSATATISILQPAVLTVSGGTDPNSCNLNSPSFNIYVNGGTSPYAGSYSFLSNGNCQYTVTDHNGCVASTVIAR
ncbi:MAG: hypothetical protein RL213_1246, partial [Bacteroidota bacterium]